MNQPEAHNRWKLTGTKAHTIRNRSSKLFQAAKALKARHRWCLTGTPIQNSVEDLGALVEFLRVEPFDNPMIFKNTFTDSGYPSDGARWERLRSLFQCIALRRTKGSIGADLDLPPRHEFIQAVDLNQDERRVYDMIGHHFRLAIGAGAPSSNTFSLILRLRQVCDHGRDLLPLALRDWLDRVDLVTSQDLPGLMTCEMCDITIGGAESSCEVLQCLHQVCQACIRGEGTTAGRSRNARPTCPICDTSMADSGGSSPSSTTASSQAGFASYEPSSKVKALLQNLEKAKAAGSKGDVPEKR
jgi:SNF2 family DNA or RNA helicase